MSPTEYSFAALRTNSPEAYHKTLERLQTDMTMPQLLLGALGLVAEAGEAADLVKKEVFHGAPQNVEKLKYELGDVLWYMNLILHSIGSTFEEVMQLNIDKLKKRYPKGFKEQAANSPRLEEG